MNWREAEKIAADLEKAEKSLPEGSKVREEIKQKRLEYQQRAQVDWEINETTPREDQGR